MTEEQPTNEVPDPPAWAQVPKPPHRTAAEALPDTDFPLVLRGYDRDAAAG